MEIKKKGQIATQEELVISAILAGKKQEEAARAAGISRRTVVRWLSNTEFRAKLEAARAEAFRNALNTLQANAGQAVEALLKNLKTGNLPERRQAAAQLLSFAFKGHESTELLERLERIEKIIEGSPAYITNKNKFIS